MVGSEICVLAWPTYDKNMAGGGGGGGGSGGVVVEVVNE